MSSEQRRRDRFHALDPERSIVVEACAGSGKTWLLVSRLIRIMLAGARPGDILAITYTRKAAREIEARLRSVLAELATKDAASVTGALIERGIPPSLAPDLVDRARALYEHVLRADPPITITTFHGWFARLVSGAPLEAGIAGRTLEEAASALANEAWAMLSAQCGRDPTGETASSLIALYEAIGSHCTRRLMRSFIDRRAEWRVWQHQFGGSGGARNALRQHFKLDEPDPLENFPSAIVQQEVDACVRLLAANGAKGATMAESLRDAMAREEPQHRFEGMRAALFTGKNEPRALKIVKDFFKVFSSDDETRLVGLFGALCERVRELQEASNDRKTGVLNLHAVEVGEALLAEYARLKESRRVMDFADLECEVDKMLSEEGSAAFLQARLDARYRHILLDEFQDTNPLQWRILRSWLDAYGADIGAPPRVFLVGDPKQSIYRFRRAEPKLFDAASAFFRERFGATHLSNAHTFRNSGPVVSVVNELFARTANMEGFQEQTSERQDWPGRIEVLPLVANDEQEAVLDANTVRNPLFEARAEEEDLRRSQEARLIAERIKEMVGVVAVRQHAGTERTARYGDVLILTRRTIYIAAYEQALRAAGIPFVSPGRGGLLQTLEARDLLALLRFLADPKDNLALAHVLRSPVFHFHNDHLLTLSALRGQWWESLKSLVKKDDAGKPPDADWLRAWDLLSGWISMSQYLPAHDLIDRIFHQGDWMSRYRAAAPEALWPGIHANLESLLELALNVDAGRYPSLTRFVDELSRMADSSDEAPDEGIIRALGDDAGRVRIMTIHGAKGLEAPIVWLIDAHTTPRSREGFQVVMDWPTESTQPREFSVIGSLKDVGRAHRDLLAREELAASREELNLLYVAMTRAEQLFIVSGIQPSRALSAVTAYSLVRQAVQAISGGGLVYGEMPLWGTKTEDSPVTPAAAPSRRQFAAIGERRAFAKSNDGQSFGTKLHAWLEAVSDGFTPPKVSPEVEGLGRRLLAKPSLIRFFDPGQHKASRNEAAFVDTDGNVGRIDRWVDFGDEIWVLDYKSGKAPAGELLRDYHLQVGRYCEVMRGIFPGRTVRGMLIFTDGSEIEVA